MKKLYQVIGSAIIILFVLISAASGDEGYKEINTLELKKWMDADDRPVLVNSLSPIEFGESYIPGSICIPMEIMLKINTNFKFDFCLISNIYYLPTLS